MADISKINGVPIANIEKLDAVLAANIAKVNGLVFSIAPAVPSPAAAYSVRLLDSAVGISSYTGAAMRVRRETAGGTGDDDEADIAFDSGVISLDSAISNASAGVTATTLGQFLNVGTVNGTSYTNPDSLTVTASCFTDTWYDQSGNANHAEQATHGSQPQIHSGTVNTDLILENGKPAVTFNSDKLVTSSITNTDLCTTNAHTSVTVFNDTSSSGFKGVWGTDDRVIDFVTRLGNTNWQYSYGSSSTPELRGYTAAASDYNRQNLSTVYKGSTNGYWRLNGSQIDSGAGGTTVNTGTTNLELGESVNLGFTGNLQEVISWPTDNYNNRTAIEQNINSNYLIYQPTDQPTSGLLYDYGSATGGTDAAAAYSVRQLSDKAVICMRIRRDMGAGNPGDDDEINIGFDANGDLDTQAIADFCGTGTGYVTRWWDQSTNGNHADQPVGGTGSNAFQPQIYNGTAVITENGKPALSTNGSQYLTYSTISFASDLCFVNVQTAQVSAAGYGGASGNFGSYFVTTTRLRWRFSGSSSDLINFPAATAGDQYTSFANRASGTMTMYYNGVTYGSPSTNTGTATFTQLMAGNGTGALGLNGNSQEIIFWAADQSSNRTGIETNIDNYFQIP